MVGHTVELHLSGKILFIDVNGSHSLRGFYLENHLSSVASASCSISGVMCCLIFL